MILIITFLFALVVMACVTPIFLYDSFEEYRKTVKNLIVLLDKKGYYPQQILNVLSFYDSEFFIGKTSEPIEILMPLT